MNTYYPERLRTSRKSDLKRHHTAKHISSITPVCEYMILEKNVTPNEKNVNPNEKNVNPQLICKKCNKIYKTKGSFENHEVKCNGIDELTCPRCMISFTTRQAKSKYSSGKIYPLQTCVIPRCSAGGQRLPGFDACIGHGHLQALGLQFKRKVLRNL